MVDAPHVQNNSYGFGLVGSHEDFLFYVSYLKLNWELHLEEELK